MTLILAFLGVGPNTIWLENKFVKMLYLNLNARTMTGSDSDIVSTNIAFAATKIILNANRFAKYGFELEKSSMMTQFNSAEIRSVYCAQQNYGKVIHTS